jgi:hypothetical protein
MSDLSLTCITTLDHPRSGAGGLTEMHIYNIYIYIHTKKKRVLLLVKMKEKKLLKIQSLPKVLRTQAIRATT